MHHGDVDQGTGSVGEQQLADVEMEVGVQGWLLPDHDSIIIDRLLLQRLATTNAKHASRTWTRHTTGCLIQSLGGTTSAALTVLPLIPSNTAHGQPCRWQHLQHSGVLMRTTPLRGASCTAMSEHKRVGCGTDRRLMA